MLTQGLSYALFAWCRDGQSETHNWSPQVQALSLAFLT